jgi:hypothetical protein
MSPKTRQPSATTRIARKDFLVYLLDFVGFNNPAVEHARLVVRWRFFAITSILCDDWSWPSFSHSLNELIREQVLNLFGKDDPDQSPVPLQKPELKTKSLLRWQRSRPRHFEPSEAVLRISKNLPNGPDGVRCYSDCTWRGSIWHHSYRPTNSEQLGQRLARNKSFYNRIRDGSGGYVSPKRTDLHPGATHIRINNLIGERDAHRVEIYMPRNCIDIVGLNGAYQHE